ncbi:MAG: hypothetical protein KDA32_08400 [Phycisphaerales bacterium]|nr:hypothetical protein [Phycisphaerales bacterium]
MKRTVPLLIVFSVGLLMVVHYFVPFLGDLANVAVVHFNILAAVAMILGAGNLLFTHGEKIYKQHSGWGYSIIAVGCFLAMIAFGMFKIGAPPKQGATAELTSGASIAMVDVEKSGKSDYALKLRAGKLEPDTKYEIKLGDKVVAETTSDYKGSAAAETAIFTGSDAPDSVEGMTVSVGELTGKLEPYGAFTGAYDDDGTPFWFFYYYAFVPLQQTTFAMLAFYVASAAFRAFRARNVEAGLLLGTAFLILLGQTFAGNWLTQGLPKEGFWSFFQISELSAWVMIVFNTAGQRAIMIGIALGIASTSLKTLLGLDRSVIGAE